MKPHKNMKEDRNASLYFLRTSGLLESNVAVGEGVANGRVCSELQLWASDLRVGPNVKERRLSVQLIFAAIFLLGDDWHA